MSSVAQLQPEDSAINSIGELRQILPDYAKDTRLNLGRVLNPDSAEGLDARQLYLVALASAYATRNTQVVHAVTGEVSELLSETEIESAKAAATIMAMNNIYYRFVHLASDADYGRLAANLRMNVIGNPGIDIETFELMSLAVSALNGCGMCIDAHTQTLTKAGVSKQGVQTAIRVVAVLNAAAQALSIEGS